MQKQSKNWPGVQYPLKETQMGLLLVFVCPCFRENVLVTCKIVSFLCSLDHFLLKYVIIYFFFKSNFKMALIWKKKKKTSIFTCFSHQGNDTKIPSALTYIHTRILLTLLTFLPHQFCKKLRIYHVWFLPGVTPGADSFSRHFWAINK